MKLLVLSLLLSIASASLTCTLCKVPFESISAFLENKYIVEKVLEPLVTELCVIFGIDNGERSVCKGAIGEMGNSLMPALAEGVLSVTRVCDEVLHVCKTPEIV